MRSRLALLSSLLFLAAASSHAETNAAQAATPATEDTKLSSQLRVYVREFRFKGNTVFTDKQLAALVAQYVGREITSEDLEEARRSITLFYVSAGFVNSGAILEDQDIQGGIITFKIVEGVLSSIDLKGNKWLRSSYLKDRIQAHAGPPLNMNRLKEGLELLRENPNVMQINAELQPGASPGESILDMSVKERQPFRLALQIDNHRPPSVGAEQITLLAADENVSGHSDPLSLAYGIAHNGQDGFEFSGDENISGSYAFPFTRWDSTIEFHGSKNDTSIVEEPFNPLDITSETSSYGITIRQPVYQTLSREVALSITGERRQNETFLKGKPFNLSPGAINGEMTVSVLRFSQEWIERSQEQVLALRSTFNLGVDVLGATVNNSSRDGEFLSWLGQFQYVRRLFHTANQVIVRTDVQWTDDPLLALEQISVGGSSSVRGYRENQLVRDRGVVSSLEFHIPVLSDKSGAALVQLAPFFDYGGAWEAAGNSPRPTSIYSAGIGLLLTPNQHVYGELYWGHPFVDVKTSNNNAQDLGLHFKVVLRAF
jgi:hemolysin activation/secretion protein